MELTQNLWERYGFTDNPYDTKALSLSKAAPLSVQEAYIPRADSAATADLLTNFLREFRAAVGSWSKAILALGRPPLLTFTGSSGRRRRDIS